MKNKAFTTLMIAAALASCAKETKKTEPAFIAASNDSIAYIGRSVITDDNSRLFTFPGFQIRANFSGTSLKMKVKPNSGYFMVKLDDMEPFKVASLENDSVITIAQNLSDTTHSINVVLAYEGYELRPEFKGFILDAGASLTAKPEMEEHKIEFIGNSITCGYGCDTLNAEAHFSNDTENHYFTYAAQTARNLKAQAMVVARSGIGIYRNYGDKKEGSAQNMPFSYPYTLFNDTTYRWDFSSYIPEVVCINLGTNDTSLDNYDMKLIEAGYSNFLATVRGNYPEAKIIFLTGSMLSGKALEDTKTILDRVVGNANKQGDKNVYRLDMTPEDGSLGYGADYHPSKARHQVMANELSEFIKSITGWE